MFEVLVNIKVFLLTCRVFKNGGKCWRVYEDYKAKKESKGMIQNKKKKNK